MTLGLREDDEIAITTLEAVMSIIALGSRKQILRDRLLSRMTDEKGYSLSI